jgi:hypothetical protein
MADDKCQEFLERVAAGLKTGGQINDDAVSVAVKQALRALIHSTAVWKEWWGENRSIEAESPPI